MASSLTGWAAAASSLQNLQNVGAVSNERLLQRLQSIASLAESGGADNARGRGRPHGSSEATKADVENVRLLLQQEWGAAREVALVRHGAEPQHSLVPLVAPEVAKPPGLLGLLPFLQSELRQRIVRTIHFVRRHAAQDEVQPPADDTASQPVSLAAKLLTASQHVMSKQIAAYLAEASASTASRRLPQVACAALHCMSMQWRVLLAKAQYLIEQRGFAGVLLGRIRKYDESPFWVRVKESGEISGCAASRKRLGQDTAGSAAKILSSKHRLFMLLRAPPTHQGSAARYMLLHGEAPTQLHVVHAQTAVTMKAVQESVIQDVPMPDELGCHFGIRLSLPCTDRFSGMLLAEKHVQEGRLEWLRSHSLCAIHRAAAAQTHMFSLVPSHVSGMLAAALAAQKAGSSQMFRSALEKIFEERLVVLKGQPVMDEYRSAVLEIFLPANGSAPHALQHAKQKMVLRRYLNGNIADRNRIIHMSPVDTDRAEVLQEFKTWVIPALLPQGRPPFFNRSKWLGGEEAVSWHGLLASRHGIHRLLFAEAFGSAYQIENTRRYEPAI